jgi:hypothetical protein
MDAVAEVICCFAFAALTISAAGVCGMALIQKNVVVLSTGIISGAVMLLVTISISSTRIDG